ncbi:adenine nucleotide alpha hydrolase [Ruminococcaceae bacterium OttesenSCG-928-D13]|nr:adenine nucleotide alpha hydrolase [Ruminococcaceae bacterium OttesenSCG-928-D13]
MRFAASYSFGKDSALAFWRMLGAGHTPVCLITTVNPEVGRSWFHGVSPELMEAVAARLGVPLLCCPCEGEHYHTALEENLAEAKTMGAEACVFGDIDIEGHLEWNRERCANAGLECVLPLWQADRRAVVDEIIAAGFTPVVKCVQNAYRPLLGQPLTAEVVAEFARLGADPCGENGEYHTFVTGGPSFSAPVPVRLGEVLDLGTHSAVDIQLA